MAIEQRTKQPGINKDIEAISERINRTGIKPGDLVIPISIGAVLILLTWFVFVPMISSALDYQTEIKSSKEKIAQLEKLENDLNNIDQNQLNDDVVTAKTVVPKVLKVSDFIYYVDELAKSKNLKEQELSAGDKLNSSDSNSDSQVSGPVEYSGSFDNVVSFLEEVQSSSPYIINIKNVELSESGSTGDWQVSLNINGYYMDDSATAVNIYSPFTLYTKYSTVMDTLRTKSSALD